jgi:hypothetical protein
MPTIKIVLRGSERVIEADRVMRDSQQYVAERREAGRWQTVGAWPRQSVDAVLRRVEGQAGRWFPEDVRTSAGLDPQCCPTADAAAVEAPLQSPLSSW